MTESAATLFGVELDTIIKQVRQIAEEVPDYVYCRPADVRSCVYKHNGKGSCLIGRALEQLGVLGQLNEDSAVNGVGIMSLFSEFGTSSTKANMKASTQLQWLSHAQQGQDCRSTWGNCIARADRTAPL